MRTDDDILPTGSDQSSANVRREQRSLHLGVGTEDVICHSIADGVAPVVIRIRRIEKIILVILLPECGCFDENTLPDLIDSQQSLRLSFEGQPIGRNFLDVQPDLIATAIPIVLPKDIALTVSIYEGAWVNRAAFIGLADKRLRIGRTKWTGRILARSNADTLH